MIDLFQPQAGDDELAAVAAVFADHWLGHGPRSTAFEAAFAAHIGARPEHLLFVNSGTAGLFLAAELLDLAPGDEVVLPSPSFVAAANAVVRAGGRPVFCDVDSRTLNPSAEDIAAAVTPRTKAVVVLHYGGYPGDIARIADRCRGAGLALVEDCACSVASRVGERAVGTFGDLAMWSFDAAKVMTTGDGGMLHVRDARLAARARRLAYHGLVQPTGLGHARVSDRWWDLDVPEPGRREIGNDLTAAIGAVQLARLPAFLARRKEIVELYDQELAGFDAVRVPPELPAGHTSSYFLYWVQMAARLRDEVASALFRDGVYTTFRYAPLHRAPAYGAGGADLPGAEQAAAETLCLPLHPGLTDADVRTVAAALRKAVEAAQ
ncbi:DegT/DnrJ/EryC1/StrS family aminotransferase [Streptomyces chrestomyceticus]|uniref:DegT/DnrJ/EryC1/StrS family aminotransferase n=1 Tax=Streptomyces chrestomyceticus TaxID=68185 RepID=UPI0037BAF406